jgi:hypothetical protein
VIFLIKNLGFKLSMAWEIISQGNNRRLRPVALGKDAGRRTWSNKGVNIVKEEAGVPLLF